MGATWAHRGSLLMGLVAPTGKQCFVRSKGIILRPPLFGQILQARIVVRGEQCGVRPRRLSPYGPARFVLAPA